jgi:hypothetical protein
MNLIDIANAFESPPHKMCQEELQQYYSGINTKDRKRNTDTLVDAQTKQWVRPPGMIIRSKSYMCRFQPPKREHLDFLQQMSNWTCRVSEQTMVSFIPQDPNAS